MLITLNKATSPLWVLTAYRIPTSTFFMLTLGFVLALLLTKQGLNTPMSGTCKFSKRVIFIEDANIWSAEKWAQIFLKYLNLID